MDDAAPLLTEQDRVNAKGSLMAGTETSNAFRAADDDVIPDRRLPWHRAVLCKVFGLDVDQ
jgi:hypothetical protein